MSPRSWVDVLVIVLGLATMTVSVLLAISAVRRSRKPPRERAAQSFIERQTSSAFAMIPRLVIGTGIGVFVTLIGIFGQNGVWK